ncbi:unnamed protein product [Gongylonema pulchrum]|uniref:Secreted protein n=1 Tax=Gongylonema pulchrum TaxID=637853 RepID=A0A183ER37_9BILA|nr:unnamed protein product [Gongylonema pulchrum]
MYVCACVVVVVVVAPQKDCGRIGPHRVDIMLLSVSGSDTVPLAQALISAQMHPQKGVFEKPRYAQDEILQYVQLSTDENYSIPSTTKGIPEHYVR